MQDYFYYLWKIAGAAVFTLWGIAAIVILGAGLYFLFTSKRGLALLACVAALGSFTAGIYAAEYVVPENLEQQRQIINQDDWESCAMGIAKPTPSGRGMSNPCEYGCFRGATIRKIVTMGEFPPWPRFQRELECWRRKGPWEHKLKPTTQDPSNAAPL